MPGGSRGKEVNVITACGCLAFLCEAEWATLKMENKKKKKLFCVWNFYIGLINSISMYYQPSFRIRKETDDLTAAVKYTMWSLKIVFYD